MIVSTTHDTLHQQMRDNNHHIISSSIMVVKNLIVEELDQLIEKNFLNKKKTTLIEGFFTFIIITIIQAGVLPGVVPFAHISTSF